VGLAAGDAGALGDSDGAGEAEGEGVSDADGDGDAAGEPEGLALAAAVGVPAGDGDTTAAGAMGLPVFCLLRLSATGTTIIPRAVMTTNATAPHSRRRKSFGTAPYPT